LKAVLDTNVLVSALFWRGIHYRCLLAAEADFYELVISDEIMDELTKVLVEKLRLTKGEVEESVGVIRKIGQRVEISKRVQIVKDDPDDDKFLEAAIASGAEIIVSGDQHLLQLH
jgi:putative PIN family toxin of toxin-antitoxin system